LLKHEAGKMFPKDKLAELSATPFFAALSPSTLDQLRTELELTRVPGGEILFRTGSAGDAMYVVLSGRLRVTIERRDGAEEAIRELSRGETVGELALLTGEPRSATVQAIRDTELAMLSRAAFERAIRTDPKLISQIALQLADRQRQGNDPTLSRRNTRTIALLPFDESVMLRNFAAALAEAMKLGGSTLHLAKDNLESNGGLDAQYGSLAEDDGAVGARLDALETSHRFVLYEAELENSPWKRLCIRQADLILVVASANSDPSLSRLDTLQGYFDQSRIATRIELVLLHEHNFHPEAATSKWLASLRVAAYHHIVSTEPGDMTRLARLLTGTAIGLVLSGGGARGFAHIGVIRALSERSVPIDYIGGTSMGAVIAAQYALGWDWETMARINRDEWPRCEPQKNYTLPLVALNSARRMDQMLRRMFGAADIQNLRTKFFCVSTNLTTADAKIHREGTLWKAVRASMSIPGIGPPAIENGEIFVDGGLVNNLPVDIMKKFCPGFIFAVDVSEQLEFNSKLKESYTVSGWKLLGQRLNPFSNPPDIPSMLNILYRATTVGSIRFLEAAKCAADYCLEPPVQDFGVFDWRSIDRIIDIGYRYALRKLEDSGAGVRLGRAEPK
jgi:predicted acylesterase/phospholipase RssA/CRP-like cAMP-binding protein